MKRTLLVVLILALYGLTATGFWFSLVKTPFLYPTIDSYGWQSVPDANNGGSNNFQITSSIDRSRNMRGWLAFNISQIPSDVSIIIAKLRLRIWYKTTEGMSERTGDPTGRMYGIYRLTQLWTEYGVSWTNQPNYTEEHHATSPVPPGQGGWHGPLLWMEWDLTDMVKDWRSGAKNYGVVVRDVQEDSPILYSTQFFTQDQVPGEGYYPRLLVTYVAPYALVLLALLFVVDSLFVAVLWKSGRLRLSKRS